MNSEYIIDNLRFEILKPIHNVSNFESESIELNEFLVNKALKWQEDSNKVNHIVICNDEIIAFFSLLVNFEGIPEGDYKIIKQAIDDVPECEKMPHVIVERFALDKRYDDFLIASVIFDNIVFNIKNIFKKFSDFEGVALSIGDQCLIPSNKNFDDDEYETNVEYHHQYLDEDDELFIVKLRR